MKVYILGALIGYLLGSVNLSIIISKIKGRDIRSMGSGNAGATNTLRTMGKAAAVFVLAFDVAKGMIAALIAYSIFTEPSAAFAAALFAPIGHSFPIWHGFRGGKGVATSIGVLIYLDWRVALCALAVFIITVVITRYVSLGSICGALGAIAAAALFHGTAPIFYVTLIIALLVIVRHRTNIVRLIHKEENKLGKKL